MRRYLIVAHKTLGGDHLIDHVRSLREEGPCRFLLLVPVEHPSGHTWTEGEVTAAARRKLQAGLDRFHEQGIIADGEIGDANPVVGSEHRGPAGGSGRLHRDHPLDPATGPVTLAAPRRAQPHATGSIPRIPITHLVADRVPAY